MHAVNSANANQRTPVLNFGRILPYVFMHQRTIIGSQHGLIKKKVGQSSLAFFFGKQTEDGGCPAFL